MPVMAQVLPVEANLPALRAWSIYKGLLAKVPKVNEHRWSGLNKIMDKYAGQMVKLCSQYQDAIFKALGLPDADKVRRSLMEHEGDPGPAFTWTPEKSRRYADLIHAWELEVLGVELSRKGVNTKERGVYVNLLDAVLDFALGQTLQEALESAPDWVDADALKLRRLALATRGAEYLLDAVMREGGARIVAELGTRHLGEVYGLLSDWAGTGRGTMEVGRDLWGLIGEGDSWYWNMVARSEGILAVNASWDASVRAYGIPYERWVATAGCCELCDSLDGEMWVAGEGPRPVTDTHPNCLCAVTPVWEGEHDVRDRYDEPSPYGARR